MWLLSLQNQYVCCLHFRNSIVTTSNYLSHVYFPTLPVGINTFSKLPGQEG